MDGSDTQNTSGANNLLSNISKFIMNNIVIIIIILVGLVYLGYTFIWKKYCNKENNTEKKEIDKILAENTDDMLKDLNTKLEKHIEEESEDNIPKSLESNNLTNDSNVDKYENINQNNISGGDIDITQDELSLNESDIEEYDGSDNESN